MIPPRQRPPGREHLAAAALAALCALLGPRPAAAQWVRVRARTAVWAELSSDGARLQGWLADDRGVRLPDQRVVVQVLPGPAEWVTTNSTGSFELPLRQGSGAATARVAFPGGAFHAPSSLETTIDPSRLPVRLSLVTPTEASLDDESVELQVRAERSGQPVSIPVTMAVEGVNDRLAEVSTDRTGWAALSVPPAELGTEGHVALFARYPGDETNAPALARAELLLVDPTTVTLDARRSRVSAGDTLSFEGTLTGHAGPLGGEEVLIVAGTSVVASARTGADGRFTARVPARDLVDRGSVELVAAFDSPVRARRSSRSAPVVVHIAVPEPLPAWVLVVPAVLTLALLLSVLASARGWRMPRLARRRASPPPGEPAQSGLQAPVGRARHSRFREYRDIAGVVWDPYESRPVPGAAVTIHADGEPDLETRSGRRGEFSAADLPAGVLGVSVESPGFVPERFEVVCPHDGSALHLRVHLVQVRHRALETYRGTATPLLPRPGLWGFWTPREVAVHAVRSRPSLSDEIAQLTSRFEEIYYSGRLGRVEDLATVRALSGEIRREPHQEASPPDDG